MNILIITHATFEKPGYIKEWAIRNRHLVQEVAPYQGEQLPLMGAVDFLIVMGGPQSPLLQDKFPYLRYEIDFIKDAIRLQKPIMGVCLGAQLISEALGARTERSPHREIGKYPIQLLDAAVDDPIFRQFPKQFDVMHWHNDMPGIPEGAELLALSEGCPRQIYRYGDRIYGFQCHLELTKDLVSGMIEHCPDDLKVDRFVMSADELMAVNYAAINSFLDRILEHLAIKHTHNIEVQI